MDLEFKISPVKDTISFLASAIFVVAFYFYATAKSQDLWIAGFCIVCVFVIIWGFTTSPTSILFSQNGKITLKTRFRLFEFGPEDIKSASLFNSRRSKNKIRLETTENTFEFGDSFSKRLELFEHLKTIAPHAIK